MYVLPGSNETDQADQESDMEQDDSDSGQSQRFSYSEGMVTMHN